MIVDLKQKSQVTIPKEILRRLNLNIGDKFEVVEHDGNIVLTPVVIIPKNQAWFYSEAWQENEAAAQQEIHSGELHTAGSAEELLSDLRLSDI